MGKAFCTRPFHTVLSVRAKPAKPPQLRLVHEPGHTGLAAPAAEVSERYREAKCGGSMLMF